MAGARSGWRPGADPRAACSPCDRRRGGGTPTGSTGRSAGWPSPATRWWASTAAARANPFFNGRVAHGYLIVSFAAGLFVDPAPGPVLANYGIDSLRFLTPVYPGDTLGVRLTCKEINPRENADHGEVRWDCQVTQQDGKLVAQYDVLTMVAKTWPPA